MSASSLVFCENLQLTAVVSFCNARTNNVFVMLQKVIKGSCNTSRKKTKPFGDRVISEESRKGFRNIFYNILEVYLGPYLTYMMEKVVTFKGLTFPSKLDWGLTLSLLLKLHPRKLEL